MYQADLMVVGEQFFAGLHGQPSVPLLNPATICVRKKGEAMRIISLPPT